MHSWWMVLFLAWLCCLTSGFKFILPLVICIVAVVVVAVAVPGQQLEYKYSEVVLNPSIVSIGIGIIKFNSLHFFSSVFGKIASPLGGVWLHGGHFVGHVPFTATKRYNLPT